MLTINEINTLKRLLVKELKKAQTHDENQHIRYIIVSLVALECEKLEHDPFDGNGRSPVGFDDEDCHRDMGGERCPGDIADDEMMALRESDEEIANWNRISVGDVIAQNIPVTMSVEMPLEVHRIPQRKPRRNRQ